MPMPQSVLKAILPQGVPAGPSLACSCTQNHAPDAAMFRAALNPRSSCNGLRSCSHSSAIGACDSNGWVNFCWRRGSDRDFKAILFTSCHRAEGRTTLVLTLARALSRQPLRTLVVDADLTGPMVARLLGLRPQVGLDDVVEDGKAIADALIDAPDDHLTVLPMRTAVARPARFPGKPRLDMYPRPAPPRVRPDPG